MLSTVGGRGEATTGATTRAGVEARGGVVGGVVPVGAAGGTDGAGLAAAAAVVVGAEVVVAVRWRLGAGAERSSGEGEAFLLFLVVGAGPTTGEGSTTMGSDTEPGRAFLGAFLDVAGLASLVVSTSETKDTDAEATAGADRSTDEGKAFRA